MYDEKLEKLIEMALIDGVLTEKERQVLLRKGEALGVDPDELEMVLEARLYEKNGSSQQSVNPPPIAATPNKHGDVQKCPACGASVRAFLVRCDDCGHEFNNVEANTTAQALFLQLTEIESEILNPPKVDRKNFVWDSSKSSLDNIIEAITVVWASLPDSSATKGNRLKQVAERQSALIRNYPIPNTKNDFLEFLALSVPHARAAKKIQISLRHIPIYGEAFDTVEAKRERMLTAAWKYKCEQVIVKARFSLKEDTF